MELDDSPAAFGRWAQHEAEAPPPLGGFELLYQDATLLAVHKPAGWLVHPSPIDRHETRILLSALRRQVGQRVYPAHRLDKPTSGVLLLALDPAVLPRLSSAFETGQVHKRYWAITRGWLQHAQVLDHPIERDPEAGGDKVQAITHLRPLAWSERPVPVAPFAQTRYSLIELEPLTGRRHQLRRHLKHLAHPIIGDSTWGKGAHNRAFAAASGIRRMLLAAVQLRFMHPVSGQPMCVQCPPAADFRQAMHWLGWDAVPERADGSPG